MERDGLSRSTTPLCDHRRTSVTSLEHVWRTYDPTEARLTAPLSARMLDLARVGPGMRVLDLATGRGEPAIPAAHRVGPRGSVLGVDLSASMLAMARERADREGLANLELRVVDAAALADLEAHSFDAVLARWGLMYMASPRDALRVARDAMAPHARLVVAVWAEPERVPYFTLPRRVLERYRALPALDHTTPGTFRYAPRDALARDIECAGLKIEHTEEIEVPVMEAATGDELIAWVRAFGLARLLEGLPDEIQRAWEKDLVSEAEPLRKHGFVRLGGVTRVVVARQG
jgi:ubiquinone/menaquinone biosynthesis C-methylase UbiE